MMMTGRSFLTMIDDTDIVTYFSTNALREDLQWTAYVVLPNGEYWGVRFSSATEAAVIAKAVSFYNTEKAKYSALAKEVDPWAGVKSGRDGSHIVGKVWMKHTEHGLKRVALTEITMYEKQGYYRSGP